MNNHVHLALESPLGLRAMISFMHGLNQSYTMRFNSKYKKVGHLWQNRYKNFIVKLYNLPSTKLYRNLPLQPNWNLLPHKKFLKQNRRFVRHI